MVVCGGRSGRKFWEMWIQFWCELVGEMEDVDHGWNRGGICLNLPPKRVLVVVVGGGGILMVEGLVWEDNE